MPGTDRVALRPVALVHTVGGVEYDDPALDDYGIARWHIPEHASRTARRAASAIAMITTRRLRDGWSLAYAFRTAAFGRDQIRRHLAEQHFDPVRLDRKTISAALNELVTIGALERVGQLDMWTDPEEPTAQVIKSGAYIYRLVGVHFRQLGDLARAALTREMQLLGGIGGERRVQRCLKWAIEHAREGVRNAIGYWLTRRCIDAGLSEGDTMAILGQYQANTPRGRQPYTPREARATVRSAHRYHG
jgi:hypothetical protein